MPLLLTRTDVQSVLTMNDAIAAVEDGFRQLALGKVMMGIIEVLARPFVYHKGIKYVKNS